MKLVTIDVGNKDVTYLAEMSRLLEQGSMLLLEKTPFLPTLPDSEFLRNQKQSQRASHKNIAYKPHLQRVTGTDDLAEGEAAKLQRVLATYSEGAIAFLGALFPDYARLWKVDYASFRPVEEEGRELPVRHRNDLLHLDAFPSRPTNGGRILRAFTNLNAERDRIWATSDSFEELANSYAHSAGLEGVCSPLAAARRRALILGKSFGLPLIPRSPYDQFMLNFHHYLKSNTKFQEDGQRARWNFPPSSTWITFTDQVAHAVVSGQYALEQTCIVPLKSMLYPEYAPIAVLEKIAGKSLSMQQN